MSTSTKCPVCGNEISEKDSSSSGYDCKACGFHNAYIRYFTNKRSYELWLEKIAEILKQKNSPKRKPGAPGSFWVGDSSVAYFDAEKKIVYIVRGSSELQTEKNAVEFSASERNYAILYADGRVQVFCDDNEFGQKNTGNWKNIRHILAAPNCTYGVTESGEVLAAGSPADGTVLKWKEVKALKSGPGFLVGLHTDGTISISNGFVQGLQTNGRRIWENISQIEVSRDCILGLTTEGRVRFLGKPEDPRKAVEGWEKIVSLAVDNVYAYGLSQDGKVHVAGKCKPFFDKGRSAAAQWDNVVALSGNQGGVGAVTQAGELKFAGTITGDLARIRETWEKYVKPVVLS